MIKLFKIVFGMSNSVQEEEVSRTSQVYVSWWHVVWIHRCLILVFPLILRITLMDHFPSHSQCTVRRHWWLSQSTVQHQLHFPCLQQHNWYQSQKVLSVHQSPQFHLYPNFRQYAVVHRRNVIRKLIMVSCTFKVWCFVYLYSFISKTPIMKMCGIWQVNELVEETTKYT